MSPSIRDGLLKPWKTDVGGKVTGVAEVLVPTL